jgi:hypothetical protein
LVTGFTNAYLYTGTDGAMTFWAPDDGATTGGSTHPRSELRELLNTNDNSVNWTLYGTHVLTATCVVSNVPADTGKVCIGQIHEPDTQPDGSYSANNEEMIMFDLANQTIYANINLDGNSNATFSTTFISGSGVALGKAINYTMSVVDGVLQISINGVTNAWNLFSGTNYQGHVATNWGASSGNTVYFKAGDYNQTSDSCGCSTDGARVAFYSLVRYHAASITNEPAGQAVVAGNNASFTVAASGNGMLSYQWWYNATNRVGGATNATFTLTNVSGTNAGNYTVTVSDNTSSFSTVTSSVAVLAVGAAPAVTNQPSSLSVTAGSNVVFTVGETGTAPLTNHWWFNTNTSLPWAAGNTITITNAQTTNAGGYFVVVNNSYGAVTSMVAVLTVNVPPAITNQPASEAVNAGSNAMFNVGTTGTGLLDYQWWFNATNLLAGSTNAMLTIANVSGASAGGYTVVVSNNFGSVTSAIAVLTVIYPQTVFAFTNAGITNWICPGGVAAMQVECWGGGGAGGSAVRSPNSGNVQYGGGGAGGAYARKTSYAVVPGNTYYISVGAGGQAATGTLVDQATVPGGDSWISATSAEPAGAGSCVAKGGAGGQCAVGNTIATAFGAGGAGATNGCLGDVLFAGGGGGTLTSSTGYGGSGGGSGGTTGNGNSGGTNGAVTAAVTGGGPGGAPNVTVGSSGPGQTPPTGPGGGGGGVRATAQQTGGNGATGQVVLTCTFGTQVVPAISGASMAVNRSAFTLSGTGGVSQVYVLLSATSLIPPVMWAPMLTNNSDTNGAFSFTDSQITNAAQRFYRVTTP